MKGLLLCAAALMPTAIQGLNQKVDLENAKVREDLKRRDAENAELKSG